MNATYRRSGLHTAGWLVAGVAFAFASAPGCKQQGPAITNSAAPTTQQAAATKTATPKATAAKPDATPDAKPTATPGAKPDKASPSAAIMALPVSPTSVPKTGPAGATSSTLLANEPPSFEIPIYRTVGIGQEVGFGLEVIDKEGDLFRVELVTKPASATFDPYTLTVVFKPTAADQPNAQFVVQITETLRSDSSKRVFQHAFAIAVAPKPQPLPTAQPLGPAVEQFLTIHDKDRLAAANEKWTLSKLLVLNAELAKKALPEAQKKVASIDAAALYKDFLGALSKAHANPALDPTKKDFDATTWGNPEDWKIIAVRARLDKSWHEVRVVLKAKAHAATYAMFKYRPVGAGKDLPVDARSHNNKVFGELVLKHFFNEGKLSKAHTRDKAAHSVAVGAFLDDVLKYDNPHKDKPWATPGLAALPCEARLGGGTFRYAGGETGGDAWGWNVQKPVYTPDAAKPGTGRMKFVNIPIKGFVTDVAPNADNTAWAMRCGDMFDPTHSATNPDRAGLCRPSGHVDLPASKDGYSDTPDSGPTSKSFVDAAHLFWKHKFVDMVRTVPLRDPRRDVFEEKGMTCSQCHVRKFGVRDMQDAAAYDPKAMPTKGLNKSQATTYFVLVPTTHWQPYMVDFQHKQECKAKVNLAKYAGVETDLSCPLNTAARP